MSYVQGTVVRCSAIFKDEATGALFDPVDVTCRVEQPSGTVTDYTLADEVMNDPNQVGRFYCDVPTTAEAGQWTYQFMTGGEAAVVDRKTITVRPAVQAPA